MSFATYVMRQQTITALHCAPDYVQISSYTVKPNAFRWRTSETIVYKIVPAVNKMSKLFIYRTKMTLTDGDGVHFTILGW
jgi:hypothetical protein